MTSHRSPHSLTGIVVVLGLLSFARGQDFSYVISTVAGSDWVGDGGPATQAILLQSEGVALSGKGSVYFSDALSHRVREVLQDGTIRTIAGIGRRGFSGDGGPAVSAELNAPYGLAVDRTGYLFIADLGNGRVRRVAPDGTITTLVSAPLKSPRNLALDDSGTLFISDFEAHRVYAFLNGSLTPFAGTGTVGFQGDGGAATNAQIGYPAGLAVDRATGAVYIGDTANRAIRRVAQGAISTVARVTAPTSMAFDAAGTLHVADPVGGVIYHIARSGATTASTIPARDLAIGLDGTFYIASGNLGRSILPSGITTIIAGGGNTAFGDGGKAVTARLNHPSGVAADPAGNIYIADRDNHRIRRVSPEGIVATVAGTGEPGNLGDGGLAVQAQLNQPSGVSLDSAGNLYVADKGNGRIRIISPQGRITAGPVAAAPVRVLPDNAGSLFIADESLGLLQGIGGTTISLLKELESPGGLALDPSGNLYFSETDAARVSKLSPSRQLTEVAAGSWRAPRGLAIDAQSNLIVADMGRQQLVQVDVTGRATAIAGTGMAGFSGDGDAAILARLSLPWDVSPGPAGTLLIADLDNNRIRQLTPATLIRPSPVVLADAVNAASGSAGPLTPGMLVALRATSIQPGEVPQTEFLFAGRPAQFVSIDSASILVAAPVDAPSNGPFTIEIRYQGLTRVTIPAVGATTAPTLFLRNGQAAVSNEDGGINTSFNGAAPGSAVALYGTGLGVINAPVTVQIGGVPAEVLYAGPSGELGIFQVNVRLPQDVPSGEQAVVVSVGGVASAPANVSVRPSLPTP